MAFWIFIVVVALYVAAAGYTDFRMGRIPNYLTVPSALAGFVGSLLRPPGYPDFCTPLNCLLGFALGFAIFFLPFFFRGGGAGDVKLAAALGAWLGWQHLLWDLAISLIFAALLALVLWTTSFSASRSKARKAKAPAGGENRKTFNSKAHRKNALSFAIPIALGTWCLLGGMVLEKMHPEKFQQPSRSTVGRVATADGSRGFQPTDPA